MPLAARRLAAVDAALGSRRRSSGGRGAFRFGDGVEPFANSAGRLRAGETVEIVTPGAGGYSPPAEREP
jgi:N-methylhydantoinase B/oxoprolinase/acetone carboxylase alpha subunit